MNKTRYIITILLLFGCNSLFAQDHPPAWGGGADQSDLSFGFSFSYVSNYFKVYKKPNWRTPFLDAQNGNLPVTSPLTSISSANTPGFAVGFITRYRVTEHLEARVNPSLIFADRSIRYTFEDESQNVNKAISPTTIDFPLTLKLKSDRVGDYRGYLIAGVKYSYAIGANKKDANAALIDKSVKNVAGYASYELGVGCDIYFEYFKLSPEIKISNSFGNVLVPENQPFASPLSQLFLHTVSFSLYFE